MLGDLKCPGRNGSCLGRAGLHWMPIWLCLVGDFAGGVESLPTEWGRESNLGVEIGDRVVGVGERGKSMRWANVFFDCCWEE